MKKVLILCIAAAMLMSFVACSTIEETALPSSASQATENSVSKHDFEEITVIDNEACTIKITGIDPDNLWGYTLKAHLENKSADKTYMFSVEDAAVNGVCCSSLFAQEVAAGKKANSDISLSVDELQKNGIKDFTDIELSFRVYDSNDWTADAVAHEAVHIYPYGEEKATKYERAVKDTDNVIIDNAYVSVIVTGYEKDTLFGYAVNLFLVNKTDKNIMFCVDEASVNGYMADPFYAASVPGTKCCFSEMTWSSETLEKNGITDIEEIEILVRAYDNDNWFAEDLANQKVTLKP